MLHPLQVMTWTATHFSLVTLTFDLLLLKLCAMSPVARVTLLLISVLLRLFVSLSNYEQTRVKFDINFDL